MCTELSTRHTPPTFAFSHPVVYALRVQDRVDALDKFIRDELHPKLSRLREEHNAVEHQLQRTMTKKQDSVGASQVRTPTARRKQSARLKEQAWSWKRTRIRQEMNRLEPLFELATDLRRLSKELNPRILCHTVLWQRSQSIAPSKYLTADESDDVVFDESINSDWQDYRRRMEHPRLSKEYHDTVMENLRVSKSIQNRTEELKKNKVLASKTSADASIMSSLMIFSYNYLVCGTCDARFHKDYINALVVGAPSDCENYSPDPQKTSTYICFHCWNATKREEPTLRKHEKQPCQTSYNGNDDKNKGNDVRSTPKLGSVTTNIAFQETERFKTRKIVIKNRMLAAANKSKGASFSRNNRSTSSSTNISHDPSNDSTNAFVVSTASSAVDQYIDSMASLDDGLKRSGESLSSCILGESNQNHGSFPPLLQPSRPSFESAGPSDIETNELRIYDTTLVHSNNDTKSDTDTSERIGSWGRLGSSESSICSNSIIESNTGESLHSRNASGSKITRYTMNDPLQIAKTLLKRNSSWNQDESSDSSFCSSSLFSDSSTDTSIFSHLSASSSDHLHRKSIKSALKKPSLSKSVSTNVASPNKVQDFPSNDTLHGKNVRFKSPVEEHKVYSPMADTQSNKALLETSAEIMEQIEYFCRWDTFMNAFEQNAS